MKKKLFAATFALLFIANVQAAFTATPQANNKMGLSLGGQIWQSEANGVFGEKNTLNDSDLKKERQSHYFIAIEHPFYLLPNLRIATTSLDTSGKTNFTQAYNADNETAHVDVSVDLHNDASFNVSYVDYTLYYQLLDNRLFSFDLGLTARDFGGAFTVTETANTVTTSRDYIWDEEGHEDHDYHTIVETTRTVTTDKIKINDIMPMLYIASNISLPLTNLSVFAQGDLSLKNDHSLYDYQVGLSYDLVDSFVMDFNLALGYRAVKVELENLNKVYTDLEFKGAFVGMIAHF